MFILLKSLARELMLPPAGPLVIAVLGLLLLSRRRKLGVVLIVIGVGSLWLCATPVVADVLTRFAERCPSLDPSKPVNAQAVVILGGGGERLLAPEYGGTAIEGRMLERVSYGAFVARTRSLPIAVSGSSSEARAMSATLDRDFGIKVRWVENQSGDTYENARFAARLLRADGVHRIVLVTSGTHEWRAVHEFLAAGFEVVPAPINIGMPRSYEVSDWLPNRTGLEHSYFALYELIGEPMRELMAALHLRRQAAD
jgi:uncharacterized SAM-binding protein YcdF (DUF218 family)